MAVDVDGEKVRPVGFVHAAFAPNDDLSDLNLSEGIISQLKVVPSENTEEIGAGLIQKAIEYLKAKGASNVNIGGKFPRSPFYLGLYGGSRMPGVLAQDELTQKLLLAAGFEVNDKIIVMERSLAGFRALMGREQMGLRRKFQIKAVADPMESSWWESCTLSLAERDRFRVSQKVDKALCGSVTFWDIQPLASEWGAPCRGMYDLEIAPEFRRCGMATFLVGESLRHLMQQGIGRVEAQSPESDVASLGVFQKLGFEAVSAGLIMSKAI